MGRALLAAARALCCGAAAAAQELLCVYEGENVAASPAAARGGCVHRLVDDHRGEADGVVLHARAAGGATSFKVVAMTWDEVAYEADVDLAAEFRDIVVLWTGFACQNCSVPLDGLLSVDTVGLAAKELGVFHAEVEAVAVHHADESQSVCVYEGEAVTLPPAGTRGFCVRHVGDEYRENRTENSTGEADGVVVRARTTDSITQFKVALLTWDGVAYAANVFVRTEFRDVVVQWSLFTCEDLGDSQNCSGRRLEGAASVDTVGLVAAELGAFHLEVENITVHFKKKHRADDGPLLGTEAIIVISVIVAFLLVGLAVVAVTQVRKKGHIDRAGPNSNQVSLVQQDAEGS